MKHELSQGTEILTADQITLPTGECGEVKYVTAHFLKGKTPGLWKDFPDGESNWFTLPPEEQTQMAEQLKNAILNGEAKNLWLSFDPYGEDYALNADFDKGWAALLYNACDECAAAPYSPDCPDGQENAPVDIGGQTPVPKMCAIEGMEKAARIILHFLETGKLSPETKWAVNSQGGLPW